MVRKIYCDVCGKEIPDAREIFARITYKTEVETKTKTGRISIRKVTRTADICSPDCYKLFDILGGDSVVKTEVKAEKEEAEVPAANPTPSEFKCGICGKEFKTFAALKAHEKLAHGK